MGLLILLALGGVFGGYLLGKYVNPAPAPAEPPASSPANAPTSKIYDEEPLPRDIVIEANGALTRIHLPEPEAELDLESYRPPAENQGTASPTETLSAAAPPGDPATPTAAADTPAQAAPALSSETASAVAPIIARAMPDDIAALQASDGARLPAWQRYAVPVVFNAKPKVVIVLDDVGLDRRRARKAWELPGPLTLSFMAYAEDLSAQVAHARINGHEIMLHVPMEPRADSINPGPNVLLSGMPEDELQKNIAWNLDQDIGYVGINNHMGSRFTSDRDGMRQVAQELNKRGLLFLDSVTSSTSVAHEVTRAAGVPVAVRNVFLDHEDDLTAIRHQLRRVEQIAKRTGLAVAIGHPRDNTLKALSEWLPDLDRQGFQLVPVSSVVRVAPGS